jgi:cytochrome c554/c'-like protein/doubled CXXCH motif protein
MTRESLLRPWITGGALFFAAQLLGGCSDEEVVQVVPESAIQVQVHAAPTSVDTGEKVSVHVVVQKAPQGADLTYSWLADTGIFSSTTDDSTGWTSPDNPGVYALSVVVTDGKNVAIAKADIAVATYMPADSPFYLGASSCSVCHNGGSGGTQYAAWSNSRHAKALESLAAIGQAENPDCNHCHTVGWYGLHANGNLNNGGYDESAVPRLAGVQCENCHGPGSEHPSPNFTSVGVTMSASLCGKCHTDVHHPTYDEWLTSAHGDSLNYETEPVLSAGCAKCHNGLVADDYLNDPVHFQNPAQDPTEFTVIVCAVCHDPHGNDNPGSLRNAAISDVALPGSILVEEAGAGRLCISCHNGRRTGTQVLAMINSGSAHFGPHHSIQGDMLKGVNAYQSFADSVTRNFSSSKHILVQDACITCHTHPHPGDPESGIANFTGHNFRPVVQACAPCHGEISDFDQIQAKADFDGDGTIEGVQIEVDGLLALLEQTIIDASTSDLIKADFAANFVGTLGDATKSTRAQREAGYNWCFVDFDGSHGVHNTTYTVQLLQQSIRYLNPAALPAAAVILKENL